MPPYKPTRTPYLTPLDVITCNVASNSLGLLGASLLTSFLTLGVAVIKIPSLEPFLYTVTPFRFFFQESKYILEIVSVVTSSGRLRVEEIENGFLVCLDEYGEKNGKYTSNYKKYFSKENPLSEDDIELDNGLDSAIESFIKGM